MTMSGPDPVNKPADAEPNNGGADEPRKRDKKKRARQVLVNEDELHLLEEKSKKADEYYGHYVRARADLDNVRKRVQKEKEDFVRYANERLLSEIIPILDNFERAFAAAEKVPATHNFAVGVEMILKQLREALARYGVEELNPAGEPFDPAKHEAAETIETTEHADHTVVDVLQRGYVLNGRVVQPAVVRVAVNPEAAPAPPDTDSSKTRSKEDTDSDTEEIEDGQDHRH
jgi:molecular chaperone GrpE